MQILALPGSRISEVFQLHAVLSPMPHQNYFLVNQNQLMTEKRQTFGACEFYSALYLDNGNIQLNNSIFLNLFMHSPYFL